MDFKIQEEGLRFLIADSPEARLVFETKAPKLTEDGRPVFQVRLLVMDGQSSAPIRVSVDGDPGLLQGQFVTPVGLTLHAIARRGDSVMWWTVDRLELADAPMPARVRSGGEK